MQYQDRQLDRTGIRPIEDLAQLQTEASMRRFAFTILAPAVAVLGVVLATMVPSPSEIMMAYKPVGVKLQDVSGQVDDRSDITTIASRVKELARDSIGSNADCFDSLSLADRAKLDRCGRVIYQALAEVDQKPIFTETASDADRKTLLQELRLAATEVCRERWSRDGSVLRSTSCEVAFAEPIDRQAN